MRTEALKQSAMPTVDEHRKAEELVTTLRWLALIVGLTMLRDQETITYVIGGGALVSFYNLLSTYFVSQPGLFARFRLYILLATRLLDAILVTAVVQAEDGKHGAWMLYNFVVFNVAITAGFAHTITIAFCCSGLYVLAMHLNHEGRSLLSDSVMLMRNSGLLFIVAGGASYVAAKQRQQARHASQQQKLRSLFRLAAVLNVALDTDKLLQQILEAAIEDTNADEGSVMLADEESKQLVVRAAVGHAEQFIGYATRAAEGIAGWVASNAEPLMVTGKADPVQLGNESKRRESASSLSVPMLHRDRLVGVLNVSTRDRHSPFDHEDMDMLNALASHAASNIVNSELYRKQAKMAEKLEESYSQLQLSQQQLVEGERNRAVAELAAGIAHDFNNALSGILGFLDLALKDVTEPKLKRRLQMSHDAALDAANVVRRLRLFSGKTEEEVRTRIDFNRIVEDVVALTRGKWKTDANRRGVRIDLKTETEGVPDVIGDPSEIREVLTNLIFNAVDAMPKGGTLLLRTFSKNGSGCLSISDTGIGITPEAKARVFEPFFTTKGKGGSGLGLSVSKAIITRHHGALEVESAPGGGATFTITLPAAKTERLTEASEPIPSLPPMRILVIEDDEMVREATVGILESAHHHVEPFEDGAAALERLQQQTFDVVVTDWVMPGMSGDEIASAIKKTHPGLPVIVVTGWGDLLREQPANTDAVVSKPLTEDSLLRALAQNVPHLTQTQAVENTPTPGA